MHTREEVAKVWLEKALREKDDFNKFISSWIAFNALYNREDKRYENQRIQSFMKHVSHKKYAVLLLDTTYFYTPIRDLRPEHDGTTREHIDVMIDNRIALGKRLSSLMLCIYQFRCNLFHGDKFLDDLRNQELAKESAKILIKFLELYLGKPTTH